MDASSKKRKTDENGTATAETQAQPEAQTPVVTLEDARKLLEPFTRDQLLTLHATAVTNHQDILSAALALADADVTRRKLFIRGLGPETTTDSLKALFSSYGELEEGVVITDKGTGKSKGYGFVTFKHVDGALLALHEPSKRIDGRMTVTHLASAGRGMGSDDQATRKIYVGNVPYEVSAERLLDIFLVFGEIEEGPLGFDKQGGKTRGFAFFVYKTEEGARAALVEPMKVIDGHQVMCKLAEDGKKGKTGPPMANSDDRMGVQGGGGGMNAPYNGPGMGNYPSYGPGGGGGGYNAGPYNGGSQYGGSQYGGHGSGEFSSYRMPPPQSSMGGPGMGMAPPSGAGPYGHDAGYGGPISSFMGPNAPPPQVPPPGPPGPMYPRVPPSYY